MLALACFALAGAQILAALDLDDGKKRLANEGAEALPGTSDAFAADIDKEGASWCANSTK